MIWSSIKKLTFPIKTIVIDIYVRTWPKNMSHVNYQTKISTALQMFSGTLSFIGSSLIIFMIVLEWGKKNSLYYRLMLGLCIGEIFSSLAFVVNSLAIPVDSPGVWFAYGNEVTCAIQGVFFQIGLSVMFYNSALMIYFVLRIRYQKTEIWLKDKIEVWIHSIVIFTVIVTSAIGIRLDVFNNIGVICYVGSIPRNCNRTDKIPCDRGEHAREFLWATGFAWFAATAIWLCISLCIIYRSVRKNEKLMIQKYSFAVTSSNYDAKVSFRENTKSRQSILKRTLEIRNQAFRYAFIFLICYIWSILFQLANIKNPRLLEILRYAASFFQPIQGFFNFFNFVFLRIKRIRRRQNSRNIFYALYLVVFKTDTELKQRALRKRSFRYIQNQQQNQQEESHT